MADDAITDDVAPEVTDSPEVVDESAPQTDESGTRADQSDSDWEKRFKDTQSSYTQAQQRIAELEAAQTAREAEQTFVQALSNPEQQTAAWQSLVEQLGDDGARKWAEEHGFTIEGDQSETEQLRDPRVDQLLAERDQERTNAEAQQVEQQMESDLEAALKEKGIKPADLSADARDLILDAAVLRPTENGTPDVAGAFAVWASAMDAQIKAYRATKRDQPTPPVSGSSGTPNPSLNGREDRLALANQVALEALESS